MLITQILQVIQHLHRLRMTRNLIALLNQRSHNLLRRGLIHKAHILRPDLIEENTAHGRIDHRPLHITITRLTLVIRIPIPNPVMQLHDAFIIRRLHLLQIVHQPQMLLALLPNALSFHLELLRLRRHKITTQCNILRRGCDRLTTRRRENIIGSQHQRLRLHLRLYRKRHVYRHLVAIKVRVIRRTHQRMQLNRLSLNQDRLKRLNRQPVQRRRPVQHHRMPTRHLIQNIPNFIHLTLNHLLRAPHGMHHTPLLQTTNNERLKQHQGHLLRQTALVQLQRWPHHDHRTTRIVHPLTKQVLTETSLLTLQHIRKRLQRAVPRPCHRTSMTPVIKQRIHRLLQHPLLVTNNHFRRLQRQQRTQPVVPVNDPTIQVIQIRRRKTTPFQRNQRTQVRRNHRQHLQNHPLRTRSIFNEPFHDLHLVHQLLTRLLRARIHHRLF